MKNSVFLNDVLKREGNNLGIFKLLAAIALIIGHSYDIVSQSSQRDIVSSLLHFDNAASLAIKFLFFVGGLLAANSLMANPDAFRFLLKKALRIFPALIVCILLAVFIVGPMFTKLSFGAYFSNLETWNYLFHNAILLKMRWRLPGVFDESSMVLNGSLWTLPCAILCFILLAIFYGIGFLRNRTVANVFFAVVVLCSFAAPAYLPSLFSKNPEAQLLPGCFALGALFANNKELVAVNFSILLLGWLLAIVLHNDAIFQFIFYAILFYTVIFLSSLDFIKNKLRLPFDASYGVYLYGYVVQQCVHAVFPEMGAWGNQIISIVIALPIGILSWQMIEKRFIALAKGLTGNSNNQNIVGTKNNEWQKVQFVFAKYSETNVFVFLSLTLIALIVHAFILKFVFPGYYSPLVPQHSDFYIPADLAYSGFPYTDLLFWPRPINMIFAKFIGYTGIYGSIACIIVLVCMSCALCALLIKKILKIKFQWQFLVAFVLYCGLLFSQPFFYTFYAQDIGAQVAFFLLILGAYAFYLNINRNIIFGSIILFCCALLSFFSKETYELTAIAFALLWFFYALKKYPLIKTLLPILIIGVVFIIGFIINVVMRSTFVDIKAAKGSPYEISFNPLIVLKEFSVMQAKQLTLPIL